MTTVGRVDKCSCNSQYGVRTAAHQEAVEKPSTPQAARRWAAEGGSYESARRWQSARRLLRASNSSFHVRCVQSG